MPPKNKLSPPSHDIRSLFGLPAASVAVRSPFSPPDGYSNNYEEWTKEGLAKLGITSKPQVYIIQQLQHRGFVNFIAKKERMVRVIKKFDQLQAEDEGKGRLTTLRELQSQAERAEPAAPSAPPKPAALPSSSLPQGLAPIQRIDDRLKALIAAEEAEIQETVDREIGPPSEAPSDEEKEDLPPAPKRRQPDTRTFDRPDVRVVFSVVSRSEVEGIPVSYFQPESRPVQESELTMIPFGYRQDSLILDYLSKKSWLKPTPQGLLCRFCATTTREKSSYFVGTPFPYGENRHLFSRVTEHEKTHFHQEQEKTAVFAARQRLLFPPPDPVGLQGRENLVQCFFRTQHLVYTILAVISAAKQNLPVLSSVHGTQNFLGMISQDCQDQLSQAHNLTSQTIVDELITIIAQATRNLIKKLIRESPYLAMMTDEAQDIKKLSQYGVFFKVWDAQTKSSREVFWRCAANRGSSDAAGVVAHLLDMTSELGDFWQKVMSLATDGANTMKGHLSGVQQRLRADKCPLASFVWCRAHKFNLICLHTAEAFPSVQAAYDLLGDLYRFFYCGHDHGRLKTFRECIVALATMHNFIKWREIDLKSVGETRWLSHERAATTLIKCMKGVLKALEVLMEEDPRHVERQARAKDLLTRLYCPTILASINFLACLAPILNGLGKSLQSSRFCLGDFEGIYAHYVAKIKKLSEDPTASIPSSLSSSSSFSPDFEVDESNNDSDDENDASLTDSSVDSSNSTRSVAPSPPPSSTLSLWDIHLQINQWLPTLPTKLTSSWTMGFHREVVTPFISALLLSLEKEMSDLPMITSFSIYDPNYVPKDADEPVSKLRVITDHFQHSSTSASPLISAADAAELQKELPDVREVIKNRKSEWLNFSDVAWSFLADAQFNLAFPRTCQLLQVAVIFPLGTASVERLFSKLKLIKTRLRAGLFGQTLDELLMIAIELPWDPRSGLPTDLMEQLVESFRTAKASLSIISPSSSAQESSPQPSPGDMRFRLNKFLSFRDYSRVRNWAVGRRQGKFKIDTQTETSGGLLSPSDFF